VEEIYTVFKTEYRSLGSIHISRVEKQNAADIVLVLGFISVPSSRVHELSMRRGTFRPDMSQVKKLLH